VSISEFPRSEPVSDDVAGAAEPHWSDSLPGMSDLDALQIDLDRIDSVLADLDR
jgi:hypothetical protein